MSNTAAIKIPIIQQYEKYCDGYPLYSATSYLLGLIGGAGSVHFFNTGSPFGLFLFSLALFHFSEFLWTSVYHRRIMSWDSFLLNHSPEFCGAMGAAIVEYFVESFFYPGLKNLWPISLIGLVLTVVGSGVRIAALFTAKHNFTHEIAEEKKQEHVLVTTGIYKYMRHPGYAGWFWWTIGTQIMLLNPICTIGFAVASWRFFSTRIPYEEEGLVGFFGADYVTYKAKTPTYIPLIP